MNVKQSRAGKRARRSANDTLKAFYKFWLHRFEEDNERFFGQVMRFAEGRHQPSPQIVPAD